MGTYPCISEILKGIRDLRQLAEMMPPPRGVKPLVQVRQEIEARLELPPLEIVEEKVISAAEHGDRGLGFG